MDRRDRTRALALALLLALFASACGGSSTTTIDELASESSTETTSADEPVEEPTARPTQAPEPTAIPAPTVAAEPEPEPTPEPATADEPVSFWGDNLDPGTCINRVPGNPAFEPPEIVSCNELHEEEIYAEAQLDFAIGEPYPGDDAILDIISSELCDEATIEFGGEAWDLLPYDTFLLWPLEEEWDAGDRNVFCSAAPPEGVGQKIGTAAGGTLDSDEVLIARAGLSRSIGEFEDWVVLQEHGSIDTLGTLSDGQYDLVLRRPSMTSQGLIFAAHEGEGTANSVYAYDWETNDFVDFGGFDDGSEMSTVLLAEDTTTVISALDAEQGDWDIWVSIDASDFAPLAATAANERFPTFTPDQTEIVYHYDGDLWIIGVDGSNDRQLTESDANDWESAVSPDGSTVIFASDRSGNDDIWAVSIDGGEPVNLTNHPGDDVWPTFSADGSIIYFGSDRFDPEGDRSKIMMMELDGSNQSFFSIVNASHAVVAPGDIGAELVAVSPTLDERYNYTLIEGEPGTVQLFPHSSDRLFAEIPAGWRVGEVNEQIGFLAAPDPDAYNDTWLTDGVLVLLYDDVSEAALTAIVNESAAIVSCEQFDGTGEFVPVGDGTLIFTANHDCTDTSVGGVIAFYDPAAQTGVVIEGQTDGLPSRDEDNIMITAIAESVAWTTN